MLINATPDGAIICAYAGCPVFKLKTDWALKKTQFKYAGSQFHVKKIHKCARFYEILILIT